MARSSRSSSGNGSGGCRGGRGGASLYARGLTTGEISAHFQEIYGADVSRETVSRITERVVAEKDEWCSRPLDRVYAAVFIDATVVKVRDGQVANRAFYVAVGVDLVGGR